MVVIDALVSGPFGRSSFETADSCLTRTDRRGGAQRPAAQFSGPEVTSRPVI